MSEFEADKKTMEEDIKVLEEDDIIEQEIRKRQDWVQEYKELHNGKPPDKIEKYHERKNTTEPLTPEEEEKQKAEAEEKAKKKKDKGKDKGKGAKKDGKKGKGKGKGDEEKVATVEVGPTEVVSKFDASNICRCVIFSFDKLFVNSSNTTQLSECKSHI